MNIDNIIPSTLKVVASENINIQDDLKQNDSSKSLEQLLHEEKENSEKNENSPSK